MSEKEVNDYKKKNNFSCWPCSLPMLNDSFWSVPEPLSLTQASNSQQQKNNKKAAAILCFNARSLKNRKRAADIAALLECHPADVLAINETWLSPDILDHEVIPTDYVVMRKDRTGGRRPAGGVLLAILPHLQPRRQTQLETTAEAVWAEVTVSNLRFLIASVYRAPNSTPQQNDELLLSLSLAAEQQHNYDACFVMGDFNLDVDWSTETPLPRATPAEQFLDAFDNFAFAQLIKNATRTTATSEKTIDCSCVTRRIWSPRVRLSPE
ncbi:Hypothetical predicted protein [Cloeon dipterum]|uniref:Endonuclease/exonuclease/phosphatase domain-containing protein n=1 Tax=Cloeon dipterum TaxID=197152 RepID=A0A8S1CEU3_9INSE|nr:Hypothetical predicted protein [Cloeon dipterum]